jgi:hypothetical protein
MIRASESDRLHPLMQFPIGYACVLRARQRWQQGSGNYLKVKEYSEKNIVPGSAIVVPDTQIAKEWNRDTALHILDAGGRVVLTGKQIPGGVCGFWGACGAGISTGIFVSLVTGASPLATEAWGLSNLMTSKALGAIGEIGGPRCCKRDSYLAILSAVDFVRDHFGVEMETHEVICSRCGENNQCIAKRCPFHPVNHRMKEAQED